MKNFSKIEVKYSEPKRGKKAGDAQPSSVPDARDADKERVVIRLSPEPPSKAENEQVEPNSPAQLQRITDLKLENEPEEKEGTKTDKSEAGSLVNF